MKEIIEKAKKQADLSLIRFDILTRKREGKAKLIFLCRNIAKYQAMINSTVPAFNYEFKSKLAIAVQNDELNKITRGQLEESFELFQKQFGNYQNMMQGSNLDPFDINDNVLFPEEIIEVANRYELNNINQISFEELAQEIISTSLVIQELEKMLTDAIDEIQISDDDFNRLANEYGTRLSWLGNGKELAYLADCLQSNDWLEYPSGRKNLSHPKVAAILLAHFHVVNSHASKRKELSLESMTSYVKDAKQNVVPEIEIKQRPQKI